MSATQGPAQPAPRRHRGANFVSSRLFWTLLALVLLILVDVIKDPSFLEVTFTNGALRGPLFTVLTTSAPYMMIGLGMTIVVSTAGIDLTVGSSMAVAGAVAMTYIAGASSAGAGTAVISMVLALLACLAVGAVNGLLVSRVGLQPFITTLIMMLAVRGIAKTITGGQNLAVENDTYRFIGQGDILGFPAAFIIGTVIVVLVALLMRRTALGMMIESIGISPEASRMAGLKPKWIILSVYVISAVLAAIGGIFNTGYTMTVNPSNTGLSYEMYAILAVVIGGTSLLGGKFSIAGTYVGAIIISLINTTIVWLGISNQATPAFIAVVVIVVCVLQSSRVRALLRRRRPGPASPPPPVTAQKEGEAA